MSFQDVLTSSTCDGRVQSRQLSNGYAAQDKWLLGQVSGCVQLFSLCSVEVYIQCLRIYFIYLGSSAL